MSNVHIGNVAEFSEKFGVCEHPEDRRNVRDECDIYASLAPFLTTDPGLVVLARGVDDDRWWERLAGSLQWTALEPYVREVDLEDNLSDAIRRDRPLMERIRGAVKSGGTVLPWGETAPFRTLAQQLPGVTLSTADDVHWKVETKISNHDVFRTVAAKTITRVRVPDMSVCEDEDALVARMLSAGESGRGVVLKSPWGVGGWGTAEVSVDWLMSERTCRRALRYLENKDSFFEDYPIVVQRWIMRGAGTDCDPSCDGEVTVDGEVEVRGLTSMLISETHYSGSVTRRFGAAGSGVWLELSAFTRAVGEQLSFAGYRGWFDVDFIIDPSGTPYALEINARRTGPVVALNLLARLDELGRREVGSVASNDAFALPSRIHAKDAFEIFDAAVRAVGFDAVPTHFLGTDGLLPTLGVAVPGADHVEALARLGSLGAEIRRLAWIQADDG